MARQCEHGHARGITNHGVVRIVRVTWLSLSPWPPVRVMRYHARMATQGETFGQAIKQALLAAGVTQAGLARRLVIDAGQVSRWVTDKAIPLQKTVERIEEELGADLSTAFRVSTPVHELYVSAPITGLGRRGVGAHHDAVATVVDVAKRHVNSLFWPGAGIRGVSDLVAPDIATERNMKVMQSCSALLFVQFAEIVRPSSSLVELGIGLGRRMKTTMILHADIEQPFMLAGFDGVASSLPFLPRARIYRVHSVDEACDLVDGSGRELLGLA